MNSSKSISKSPLVSVIIPAYNAEAFIERTLNSVLAQTYQTLEVLVVDDGSHDRTPTMVQAIAQTDDRVRFIQQTNAGVAAARNLGIQNAQGEFIAPIDADDLWYPDALEKLLARFQVCDSQVGVVYAWTVDIDERDHYTGGFHATTINGNVYKTLICHYFLGNASATLIRKSCLDHIGGYDTQLKAKNAQGCEDWDLYLRLAEHYKFGVVPEFLVGYRKVASSMSGDFSKMARSQQLMLQTIQHNHPEIPRFLYRLSRSSFYLYLAHQSDAYGNARATLYWLWQGVKIEPITSLGRLGLYILLVKSFAKLAGELWPFSREKTKPKLIPYDPNQLSFSYPTHSPTTLTKLHINRLKILFKVLFGMVLHQSLSRI